MSKQNLVISADKWDSIVEAVDYMAGGDEKCAEIWPDLANLKPGDTITIGEYPND